MGDRVQIHPRKSSTLDTLNIKVVPIVLLPGVMGSRLDIDDAACDWDPDDHLEMGGWLAIARRLIMEKIDFRTSATVMTGLDQSRISGTNPVEDLNQRGRLVEVAVASVSNPPPAYSPARRDLVELFFQKRGWGEVVWSFYREILMSLEEALNPPGTSENHPVYAFGYDWRQGNRDSGARLNRRIGEILKAHPTAKRVIVVTHSMGGLVTRSALTQGGATNIAGVVHTVMPASGAAVAYRRLLTGARAEFGDGDEHFRHILGDNRIDYVLTQSVARGPTELMPHDSYPVAFVRLPGGIDNKSFSDVFAEYARQTPPGVVPRRGERARVDEWTVGIEESDIANLRARLAEARTFSRSIANVAHPNTFVLFGDGRETDVEFDWTRGKATTSGDNMRAMVIKRPEGDTTVPKRSGEFWGGAAIEVTSYNVDHAGCFGDAGFREAVVNRVRRLLARA